ncbi:DUF1761 domain-containing protein [Dactylosporangium aurantiacum]|uniref:DUF1761 domain-containing protein n=1 Tax=Dactylosporangium aurantiacum TaxID=35754 RepID=A0A9Q9IDE3_9ACTN|nr:DUF1761 domain-containing protein [Dactylosporangium aurantiacum]MDG6107080.1 DUF1761 domain-containing protein [Dactylosporangium aurantiacum]UWZ51379.1 DUF1761 domain-containing protein [Dactylosporangium aurantiacum]
MVVLGIALAAVAAFIASSVYYAVVSPAERRILGDAVLDRGRPTAWKVGTELLRTMLVAAVFAWVADQAGRLSLPESLPLALVLWAGFPVALLTGSVVWEKVAPVTAAMHAGDWLLKLLLIAAIVGALH